MTNCVISVATARDSASSCEMSFLPAAYKAPKKIGIVTMRVAKATVSHIPRFYPGL